MWRGYRNCIVCLVSVLYDIGIVIVKWILYRLVLLMFIGFFIVYKDVVFNLFIFIVDCLFFRSCKL